MTRMYRQDNKRSGHHSAHNARTPSKCPVGTLRSRYRHGGLELRDIRHMYSCRYKWRRSAHSAYMCSTSRCNDSLGMNGYTHLRRGHSDLCSSYMPRRCILLIDLHNPSTSPLGIQDTSQANRSVPYSISWYPAQQKYTPGHIPCSRSSMVRIRPSSFTHRPRTRIGCPATCSAHRQNTTSAGLQNS